MASIEGYLGLALNPQTATIDERAKKYLTEAHNASQHLGRLFRDLLDVTKLDDNRDKAHLQPAELNEEVQKIVDLHRPAAGEKGLRFIFGSGEGSGVATRESAVGAAVYAMVDPDFLAEIVGNLIENAIKYTPAGGTVSVSVAGDMKMASITVADSGIGIPPEDQEHIFQKFYRVDNTDTREIGGTGLGLYIAKKRVESMNGRITVESEYGKGSAFHVLIPQISGIEYNRQLQIIANVSAMQMVNGPKVAGGMGSGAVAAASVDPVTAPVASSAPAPASAPLPTPTVAPTDPNTQAKDLSADQLAAMKAAFAQQAAQNQASQNA